MTLAMSPQVFAITSQFIEDHVGLHYGPADRDIFAQKVSDRATEVGFDSLLDYYYLLRYDDEGGRELQKLVETLTVHETYFFREPEALRVLVRSIIPEMLADRPAVRIWCAACATGEEPYTLAMMLAQAGLGDRVQMIASDVSERALAQARAGWYGPRSLRRIPPNAPFRGWIEDAGGVRVPDDIRGRIAWTRVNLVEGEAVRALGELDIVLCRNVMIYFSDATVVRVAQSFAEVLRPDGLLVMGTAESLLRFGTAFQCEERGGAFFYRRPSP
jgi:chemotaxis protein methyltransferase CheR